jgi:hypothetical protein
VNWILKPSKHSAITSMARLAVIQFIEALDSPPRA